MKTIEELRKEIDEIDSEMAALFTRRMLVVTQIGDIKKQLSLPVGDPGREQRLIDAHLPEVPPELQESYLAFYQSVFRISRAYQQERMKRES